MDDRASYFTIKTAEIIKTSSHKFYKPTCKCTSYSVYLFVTESTVHVVIRLTPSLVHWIPCSLWILKASAATVSPVPHIIYNVYSLYWVISKNTQTCNNNYHLKGGKILLPHIFQQPQPYYFCSFTTLQELSIKTVTSSTTPILSWIHSSKVFSQYFHRTFSGSPVTSSLINLKDNF